MRGNASEREEERKKERKNERTKERKKEEKRKEIECKFLWLRIDRSDGDAEDVVVDDDDEDM